MGNNLQMLLLLVYWCLKKTTRNLWGPKSVEVMQQLTFKETAQALTVHRWLWTNHEQLNEDLRFKTTKPPNIHFILYHVG